MVFDAIGTKWNIELFSATSPEHRKRLQKRILQRIDQFDMYYSRFRSDSLITTMANRAGDYELPQDAKPMFDLYQNLYDLTDGAVTPLIGDVLSAAGYDAGYSLKPGTVTAPEPWDNVLEYDYPRLKLLKPALLDVGAAGKGYLVDIVAKLISDAGIDTFCVNAGGDIVYQTRDNQKIDIGLEHPSDPTMAIGVAHINNQSLCGSSGNRRSWGTYHHIIDPHKLTSPQHIKALWVVADSGLLADGLTTALFFSNASSLRKQYTFEYAIVYADESLEHSPDFPATFFTNQDNI